MTKVAMPRGWKAVPMPEGLEDLPRERRGFPIPYVAQWESEVGRDDIERTSPNSAVLNCSCTRGHGAPDLGNQCPERQRECMIDRLCQVCGRAIEGAMAFVGGKSLDSFIEPPLHLPCAAYAVQVCPGITRRPGLGVTVCEDYALLDRYERGPEFPPMWAPHGELPLLVELGFLSMILIFCEAEPIEPVKYTPDEFVEMVKVAS